MHASDFAAQPSSNRTQTGITDEAGARALLNLMRRRDVMHFYGGDGESGAPLNRFNDSGRGHGVGLSPQVVGATAPAPELLAYHRSLGLGPAKVICPAYRPRMQLAHAFLMDNRLIDQVRREESLNGVFFRYKDEVAAELAVRLGLECVGCAPSPQAYAELNDKSNLAEAACTHGFDTLPGQSPASPDELPSVFLEFDSLYEAGCVLRNTRGAGGTGLEHAKSPAQAQRAWRRLRRFGKVLVLPYVPAALQVRNISLHGYVKNGRFAPVVVADQIVRGFVFRGSGCVEPLSDEESSAIRASLPGLSRWLSAAGYDDAPAGVDGFIMRSREGLRFVVMDPNIRLTSTMRPWSVVADLSERTGRRFVWQFEWMVFLGPLRNMNQLRRCLGADLLNPAKLAEGGILPSVMNRFGLGPAGALRLEVIFIAHDPAHLMHLRSRMSELGFRLA